MTSYAAFLRGIGPSNPNMRNEKLRSVFEGLGFRNVASLISSGNIIFSSTAKAVPALEQKIEKALKAKLGIKSAVFIRTQAELERIIAKDPFEGKEHGKDAYLIVTFLRKKPREIYTSVDLKATDVIKVMAGIERRYDKDVTTRTWKTVGRILGKMRA